MPVGFRIASAWVDIRAEDKGLRQQIKDAVEKATKGNDAKINLKIDSKGLRREVEDALKEATKGQKPQVAIGIKSTGLRKEVSDALKRATDKQKPTVKLGINSTGLRGEVQRALTAATKDQKPTVRLGISSVGLRGEVQRALSEATAGQDGTVTVHVRVDGAGLQRALADADPTITPNIDVKGMRQRMLAALRGLNVNDTVTINPNINGALLRAQIQAQVAALRNKFTVPVTPTVNTTTFAARLQAAARTVSGAANGIPVTFNPNLNALMLRAQAGRAAAAIRQNVTFNGTLNTAMTRASLMASLAAAQAGLHITVPVRFNRNQMAQAIRYIGSIEQGFRAIEGPTGRYAHILASIAALVGPAFGGADHAIRSTGASLAVLIPMVSSLVTSVVAFSVGFNHMGSVISGIFDGSKTAVTNLDDNLEKLSGNARAFALQLQRLAPAFTQLRIDVQDQLFKGMDLTLKDFTVSTLPVLRRGLAESAMGLNGMAKGAVDTVDKLSRMGTLDAMFGGLKVAMDPMVKVPGQFLNAWIKTSIAATPLFTRMTTSFGKWSTDMTSKLDTAFDNGRLQAAISKAGDTIVNFFRRIGNNPEFKEFIQRMKDNGPHIAEVFGHIAEALFKVLNALSPISGLFVALANAAAQFINALPPVFLDALILKFILFKTALGIVGLVKNLAKAMVALRLAMAALGTGGATVIAGRIGPALTTLGMAGPGIMRTSAALGAFLKVGLLIGGLMFTFRTINWAMSKMFDTHQSVNVDKLEVSLRAFNNTGKLSGEAARDFGANWVQQVDGADKAFGGLQKAIQQIAHATPGDDFFHGFQSATNWLVGGKTNLEKYQNVIKGVDKSLTDLEKNGSGKEAAQIFDKLAIQANKAGTSTEKFKSLLPKYEQALKDSKVAQDAAALAMGVYGQEAIKTQGILDANRTKTDALKQAVLDLSDVYRSAAGDEISYHEAVQNATDIIKGGMKGIKDLSDGLSVNTKVGQANRRALLDVAASVSQFAQSTLNATGSQVKANNIIAEGRKRFVDLAIAAGATQTQAQKLADQWLKMPDRKLAFKGDITDLQRKILDAQALVDTLKQKRKTAVGADKTDLDKKLALAQAALDKLNNQKNILKIQGDIEDIDAKIASAQKTLDALHQKRATAVGADKKNFDDSISHAQAHLDALKQKKKAKVEALDATKAAVEAAQRRIDALHGKTIHVTTIFDIMTQTGKSLHELISAKGGRVNAGGMRAYAGGGSIEQGLLKGPGNGVSDSLIARVSNGEYIMRAAAVQKYGTGFMRAINMERFPKFATGGVVGASVLPSAGVGVSSAPTTGTFTVKDGTGKPVASALNNFKALKAGLAQAYTEMQSKSQLFGSQFALKSNSTYKAVADAGKSFSRTQVNDLTATSTQTQSVWTNWKAGMSSRTADTYRVLTANAGTFQKNHTSATSKTSTSAQNIWSGWKTGMVKQTNSTYSTLNNATSAFSKQSVSKIGGARDGMGSAWGGLSPKFKPPVSYLVHTVLNQGVVGSMNAMMQKLGGGKTIGGVSIPGFAGGGAIRGPGTATSDSIAARLSTGEFVMQARAVNKFGVGFMSMLNSGRMPHDGAGFKPGFAKGGYLGYASGGAVPSADTLNKILGDGGDAGAKKMTQFIMDQYVMPLIDSGTEGSAMRTVQKQAMTHIQANVQSFVKENFGGAGSASAGLRWAKTQYGKPYQWGGNGNPSWDCSGFMSAIESVIRGEKPHRRWATGSFSGATAPSGWKLNASAPFKIGVTNAGVGHTAGTIGKENVESSGGAGVHGGASARGWNNPMFPSHYGYVGPNATKKAIGGLIRGAGSSTSDSIPAWLSDGEYVIRAAAAKKLGIGYLNSINAGRMPGFASGGSTSYKVKSGDTLSGIAAKFGTTTSALMSLNKSIKDANKISVGQTIVLKKVVSAIVKPGTSTTSKIATAPKGDIQDAGNVTALKTLSTLREAQSIANSFGAKFQNEMAGDFGAASSLDDLVSSLTTARSAIYDAFQGKTQDVLAAKFTATANKLIPLQQKLDSVTASLATAQTALDDVKEKFDSLKTSVSGAITDYGKITKIGTYGTSPTVLLNQLQADAAKATQFTDMLNQLKAKGISGDLIGQVADAGLSGGGMATATTLLQMTPEQVKQLNDLQAKLTATADAAGTSAANSMYGAGVSAAQGLVDGLASQQAAITAQMTAIAKSMVDAIKQALGIASPSKVMTWVGDMTADGLEHQLTARIPGIAQTMQALVTVPNPGITGAKAPLPGTGTIAGGSHGSCVHIETLNVNVTGDNMNLSTAADRRALAKTIVKEMKEEIRKDDKAHR